MKQNLKSTEIIDGNIGLSFGAAIDAAKKGQLIAREGWNGKGMFVFMRPEDYIDIITIVDKVKSLPYSVKKYFSSISLKYSPVKFTAYLCLKTVDNTIVNGWLASQTDMLAEDWLILR